MQCGGGGGGPSVIIVLYLVKIGSPKNLYLCKVYGEIRQLFGLKCTNLLSELQCTVHSVTVTVMRAAKITRKNKSHSVFIYSKSAMDFQNCVKDLRTKFVSAVFCRSFVADFKGRSISYIHPRRYFSTDQIYGTCLHR